MDMKQILQNLDNASSKPVENVNDMKKFLAVMNEGADPHKVSTEVRYAMDHYNNYKPNTSTKIKDYSLFKEYISESERSLAKRAEEKTAKFAPKAKQLAARVMEDSGIDVQTMYNSKRTDKLDTVTLDIPLLIRLLEYSREEIKTDAQLHILADKLIRASKMNDVLTMKQYSRLVPQD
jgi:hypothetical protein